MISPRLAMQLMALGLILAAGSPALGQDWSTVGYETHSAYQAIDETGASTWSTGGSFPFRLVGVVLNHTDNWLDPTPAYDSGVHLWDMGGEAELFIQAVNLDGTAYDPRPGEAFADTGGTAVWIGQNYGNHLKHQDPLWNYTDAEWTAELGRLNLQGGNGVTDPIRAGDLVEIRARGGLFYKGKMNVNEQHDNDYDRQDNWDAQGSPGDGANHDFDIVRLASDFGLPTASELTLADLKDASDAFLFDATRQAGPERYQSTLVTLKGVTLKNSDGSALGDGDFHAEAELIVTDSTGRSFPVYIGRNEAFNTLAAPTGPIDLTGIINQQASSLRGPYDDGYSLMVLDPAYIPEPTALGLMALGAIGLVKRKR